MISSDLTCPNCGTQLEQTDTTFSNTNTERAREGQHTGNIYECESCECYWLENFLNKSELEKFNY
jgi:hypothetical protein